MSFMLLAAFLLTSSTYATMTISKVDCPEQFDGRVTEILKSVGSSSAFSTQSVIFKNLSTIKGEVPEQVSIQILEHGPFELERGEDYRVQLRGGRVCWIEKI